MADWAVHTLFLRLCAMVQGTWSLSSWVSVVATFSALAHPAGEGKMQ
jgi:hypothetical protein